jgi:hypothetical protein
MNLEDDKKKEYLTPRLFGAKERLRASKSFGIAVGGTGALPQNPTWGRNPTGSSRFPTVNPLLRVSKASRQNDGLLELQYSSDYHSFRGLSRKKTFFRARAPVPRLEDLVLAASAFKK